MFRFRLHVAQWLLLCLVALPADAQLRSQPAPRVGVALSGGGALGLAHIGVLRYFEEHRIPIDALAGTSMGGLIGGLYATGMDSKQLTELAAHMDWDLLLNPSPRFVDQPIVDKQSWNRTYGSFALLLGKGFSLPAGLNYGEALSLLFSRTTLPTPFRCVATDLISGKATVFKRGSLAEAMRATMSIPGVFTPVRLDGMVLVDGGLIQNVPVETLRDMGARKVIAVAFGTTPVTPAQIKSLPDVARQTVFVAVVQNERRSLALADLVVSINTDKFSSTDYSRWKEIIQAGYDAAQANAEALKPFELSPEEWTLYLQARQSRMRPAITQGQIVSVSAPVASFQQNAQHEIRRKLGTRMVSPQALEDVLTGMAASTAVPVVTYEWKRLPDKTEGYNVTFLQRPSDQLLLRPSFQYQMSPGEPGRGNLRISTATALGNIYKARVLGTVNIGSDPSAQVEFYRPFGGSPYFIAPNFFVERMHFYHYQGAERTSETRDRIGGSLYGGIGTWRFAQLRLGLQVGYDSYSPSQAVDGVPAASGAFVTPEARWLFNSQDSGGLPTRGTLAEGSAGYSFRDVDYPFFQQHLSTFRPVNKRFSLFGVSQQESSFGRKLDSFEQFTSGGEALLSAYRYQQFHANTLLTAGGGTEFHLLAMSRLSMYPALATWYEAGRFDLGSQGWQTHQSTSSALFFPTPIGAFGLTLSFDEAGKARWRLSLGGL